MFSVGRSPTNDFSLSERGTKCREEKNDKGSNIEPRDSSDVNRGTLVAEVTYHVLQSEVKSTVTNSKFKTTADLKSLEGDLK